MAEAEKDKVLPDELLEMLNKTPHEYQAEGKLQGGPQLPEIASSPFSMNYRWPSSSPGKDGREPSIGSKKSSQSMSSQTESTEGAPGTKSGARTELQEHHHSRRAAVKSMFRSMKNHNSFSLSQEGRESTSDPAQAPLSSTDSLESTAVRRSLAMDRSHNPADPASAEKSSTAGHDKQNRRKSVAALHSSSSTHPDSSRTASSPLNPKASSATVSSMTDTVESAEEDVGF